MKKTMERVEVSSGAGVVNISQDCMGEPTDIVISADQVDVVIEWLKEAKVAALKKKKAKK